MSMTDTNNDTGLLLEAMGKIHVGLGHVKKALDERNRMQQLAYKTMQPVFYSYSDSTITTGSGFAVIRLTGPDQGHVWYVHGIGIWYPNTGPGLGGPGTGDVFVSAADQRRATAITQFSGVDWRDHWASGTFNQPHLYSRNQVVARFNEEIFVAVSGGSNTTQVAASCWVQDFEEGANVQAWAM